MITLKLPGTHPNNSILHNWARDKENIFNSHNARISRLEGILKTMLSNNPDLGKSK